MDDPTLTRKNVVKALENFSPRDWFDLGIQLDISVNKLKEIEVNGRFAEECKLYMLSFWLEKDVNRSWQKLVNALRQLKKWQIVVDVRLYWETVWDYESEEPGLREIASKLETRGRILEEERVKYREQYKPENEARQKEKQEWQRMEQELKEQQQEVIRLTNLLKRVNEPEAAEKELQQLHQALGLSEQKSKLVLTCLVQKRVVKEEVNTSHQLAKRYKQLKKYKITAKNQAGEMETWEELLNGHIENLSAYTDGMKTAGGRFASDFERLQTQLGKLTEMFHQTRVQLRSCEEEFQRYELEFSECLDKMNVCERSLATSQHKLRSSTDNLESFRGILEKKLPRLQIQLFGILRSQQFAKAVVAGAAYGVGVGLVLGPIGVVVGYNLGAFFVGTLLEDHHRKKVEVERCEKELGTCDKTLLECKEALKGYETEPEASYCS